MHDIADTTPRQSLSLEVDLERYRPFLESEDIAEADKDRLLHALWSIMVSFVQIGWGVHPAQQAQAARRTVSEDQALIPDFISAADTPQEASQP